MGMNMDMNAPRDWLPTGIRRHRRMALVAGSLLTVLLLGACGDETVEPVAAQQPTATAQAQATATRTPAPQTPGPAATAAGPAATATAAPATTPIARTPTPLPPPAPAIGDTVQTEGWQITVTGFDLFGRVGDHTASGVYLYLTMRITNSSSEPSAFPYEGLIVVDMNETTHFLAEGATRETLTWDLGIDYEKQLAPGETLNVAAVFDILPDATGLLLTTPSRVFEIRLEYTDFPK
jgi:hypothetical protein